MNFIVIVMRALYRTLHETHITAQMKLNLHNAWGRQIRSDASHMRRTVEQIDRQARPMYGSSAHASYIGARSVVALCVCVCGSCAKVSTLSCQTSCCPYNKFPLISFGWCFFGFFLCFYYYYHYCLLDIFVKWFSFSISVLVLDIID